MFNGIADYAYIPLLITTAVIVYIFFKVLSSKSAENTIFKLISLCFLCAGTLFSAFVPNIFILSATLFIAVAFLAISVTIKKTSESTETSLSPKEFLDSIDSFDETVEESTNIQEAVEKNLSEAEKRLIETTQNFIIQAAEAFTDSDNGLDSLLEKINNAIMADIEADGAAILLVDDFDDIISVKAFNGDFPPPYQIPADIPHKILRVSTNFRFAQFTLTNSIFGDIATSGKPELIIDPETDDRIFKNGPEEFLRNGSYIFVPMLVKGVVIGVIALARKFGNSKFSYQEFDRAKILTNFASVAIKNVYAFQEVVEHAELIRESEIACKLQTTLSPKLLPAIPSLSLGCYNNTAEGVCGDYYDIIPSRKDRISFVLADVAGKGMNSLIVMVMIRAIMRLVVNTTQTAGTILEWANRGISTDIGIDHFASLSLINYNSLTNTIQLSSAGTTPVYLYSADSDKIEKITSQSEPIGVEKTTKYDDKEIAVHSGDIVITFTDGLVETLNESGIQYSTAKLLKIVTDNHQKTGKEIAAIVKADIKKFSGTARLHDDQTFIIIKIQ